MNFKKAADSLKTASKGQITLEQFSDNQEALSLIQLVNDRSYPFVFLTGGAGSGKTSLIKLIIQSTKNAVLTATTGIAAMNIGGQTLHSLFRLGAKLMLKAELSKHKCPNQALFDALEILVIDEISMLRADLLDAIDQLLRTWRQKNVPFGGVMVIGCGDLLQLPPVIGRDEAEVYFRMYPSPWFFYSHVMAEVDSKMIELTKLYRQQDPVFLDALKRIRENNNHRDSVALINRNCFRDISPDFRPELILCARNDRADHINKSHLDAITGDAKTYTGEVTGNINIRSRLPAPMELVLKVGCRVMVTKNIDGAVNGQLGTVKTLHLESVEVELDTGVTLDIEKAEWEQVKYRLDGMTGEIITDSGKDSYKQIPLCLGFAVSIHKSQGLTLNSVLIDLGENKAFASGMTYTALSRCKSIDGIKLARPISMGDVLTDRNILAFYEAIRKQAA